VRKTGTEALFNKIKGDDFPDVMDNIKQWIQETNISRMTNKTKS
jgi:hypothetical protein